MRNTSEDNDLSGTIGNLRLQYPALNDSYYQPGDKDYLDDIHSNLPGEFDKFLEKTLPAAIRYLKSGQESRASILREKLSDIGPDDIHKRNAIELLHRKEAEKESKDEYATAGNSIKKTLLPLLEKAQHVADIMEMTQQRPQASYSGADSIRKQEIMAELLRAAMREQGLSIPHNNGVKK
jgi:hypothetical protein